MISPKSYVWDGTLQSLSWIWLTGQATPWEERTPGTLSTTLILGRVGGALQSPRLKRKRANTDGSTFSSLLKNGGIPSFTSLKVEEYGSLSSIWSSKRCRSG